MEAQMQLLSLVMSAVMAIAAPIGDAPAPSTVRDLHRALIAPDRRIRTVDARVTAALYEGVRRSRTFGALVAGVERSNVIAYIELLHELPPTTNGRLALVSKKSEHRYVRIQVRAFLAPDHIISVIAHELQHALEIAAAPSVVDDASLRKFYKRIGAGTSNASGFDTDAARAAGERVRGELRRATG
jgi:hypothetical protein